MKITSLQKESVALGDIVKREDRDDNICLVVKDRYGDFGYLNLSTFEVDSQEVYGSLALLNNYMSPKDIVADSSELIIHF